MSRATVKGRNVFGFRPFSLILYASATTCLLRDQKPRTTWWEPPVRRTASFLWTRPSVSKTQSCGLQSVRDTVREVEGDFLSPCLQGFPRGPLPASGLRRARTPKVAR